MNPTLLQALALQNSGQPEPAADLFVALLKEAPGEAIASYSLGVIRCAQGSWAEALQCLSQAIASQPGFAQAHFARSSVHEQLGDFAAALADAERALQIDATLPGGAAVIARLRAHLGPATPPEPTPTPATPTPTTPLQPAAPTSALALPQGLLEVMGRAEHSLRLGQPEAALADYRRYLASGDREHLHIALFNMSAVLSGQHQNLEAEALLRQCLALKPDFLMAHLNLGIVIEKNARPWEAVAAWEAGLACPGAEAADQIGLRVQIHNQLGRLLEGLGDLARAEAALHASLQLQPGQAPALQHWIHLRQKQCRWPIFHGLPGGEAEMLASASPLAMLGLTDDPATQFASAQRFVRERVGQFPRRVSAAKRYGHERLRIGYLSSDLAMHAVSLLTVEMFELHDRRRVELHAFCWSREDGSAFRERVRAAFDHFHPIAGLSDEAAAELIAECEIDVLVDLHGLTSNARPDIVARGAAPVQISYLGFPGTTALPYVDHVVADRFLFPEALQAHFTERALYLPGVFQVSDSQRAFGPRPSRESLGLPTGAFVFCAFNNNHKFTPDMVGSWMRILRGAPGSVLWLLEDNRWSRERLGEAALAHGVAPERLHFAGRITPADYLARFQAADLFLDTLPFNAGTTANDALWAGLPVLTLPGRTYASRMAGSLLTHAGLPELIAEDAAAYERIAISLARQPGTLAPLRERLIEAKHSGRLFSTENFCREFEDALLGLVNGRTAVGSAPDSGPSAATPDSAIMVSCPRPGRKFRLLVRGWRGINHSYAMVNQYQLAAWTQSAGIEVFHEDLPYFVPGWSAKENGAGFDDATAARLARLKPYRGERVDASYTLTTPIERFTGPARANFTFVVTEFGLEDANFSPALAADKRALVRGRNRIVTPSQWTRAKLIDFGFDAERIEVVPHGIDPKVFKPTSAEARAAVRAELGLRESDFVFLNIGGSFWAKGADLLLRAFAEVQRQEPRAKLLIKDNRKLYGRSSDDVIAEIGRQFPGTLTQATLDAIVAIPGSLSVAELARLYGAADVYVSPYRAEGFNMPVLEAMACGLPVLVTQGGATDDFVSPAHGRSIASRLIPAAESPYPVAGAYLEPDFEALCAQMQLAVAQPAPAPPHLAERWHWSRIADELSLLMAR